MVSTYDSRREAFDPSGDLKPYTIAKHYSDDYLRNSGLNYTIVHPGLLKDEAGSGKIEAALYFDDKGSIPREDVASVLKEVVTSDKYANQEFQILSGEKILKTHFKNTNKICKCSELIFLQRSRVVQK